MRVVVWRPSPVRPTSPVSWASLPSSTLVKVDLPAPDAPSSTTVRSVVRARSRSRPSPVTVLLVTTSTPSSTSPNSSTRASPLSDVSTLDSTRTGTAPESRARTSMSRRRLLPTRVSRAQVTSTTSTLAAMCCGSSRPDTDWRTSRLRRSRRWSTPWPSGTSQSPTTICGHSRSGTRRTLRAPWRVAQPRSIRTTRAASSGAYPAARTSSTRARSKPIGASGWAPWSSVGVTCESIGPRARPTPVRRLRLAPSSTPSPSKRPRPDPQPPAGRGRRPRPPRRGSAPTWPPPRWPGPGRARSPRR